MMRAIWMSVVAILVLTGCGDGDRGSDDGDPKPPPVKVKFFNASKKTVVYCAGGYRSSIAASRLAAAGFTDVSDLLGGYGAWSSAAG